MVKIITDSAADLDPEYVAENGITLVPLAIIFGEEVLEDGVDITKAEFCQKLLSSPYHPTTSHPMPVRYESYFREALASGEEVIHLAISSRISGCYNSACLAAQTINDPQLFIYDTKSVTIGTGLLVMQAVEMIKQGCGANEILTALKDWQQRICSYIFVSSVKYLHKSGRMTMTKKILVDMLNIKPILTVRNTGIVEVTGGIRGKKKAIKYLVDQVVAVRTDFRDRVLAVVYVGDFELAQELIAGLAERAKLGQIVVTEGSPVIGAHVGPGCAGFFFLN